MSWRNVSKVVKEKVVKAKEPRYTITILKGAKNATLSKDLVQRLGKPERVAVVVDEENHLLGVRSVTDGEESVAVHYTKVDAPTGTLYVRFATEALGVTANDGALVGAATVESYKLEDNDDETCLAYIDVGNVRSYAQAKPQPKKSTKKSSKK